MLIYTSKNGYGWGKQKPKQWGPLSSVQSAILFNAEQLGIDPADISAWWPFFEQSGAYHDAAGKRPAEALDFANAWSSTGIYSPITVREVVDNSDSFIPATDESGTMLVFATIHSYQPTQPNYIMAGRYLTTGDRYYLGHDNFSFEIGFGSAFSLSTGLSLEANKPHLIGMTWGPNIPSGFVDESIVSFSQAGAGNRATNLAFGGLGHTATSTFFSNVTIHQAAVLSCRLSSDQTAQLSETPYALIQPVPRPFYLDMGANLTPTLISPSNGLTGVSQPINFQWSAVSGATGYQLQIDEATGDFSTPVVDDATLTGTSKSVSGLSDGTEYKWRVRADV